MGKYIDADRLKVEIERRKQSLRAGICSDDAFTKEQKREMLDDPKARVEFNNHNEEYYYNKVLNEYIKSKNETDSEN